MRSCIVMTVSGDRPEYLAQTLQSWRCVRGLSDWSFRFCVEPGSQVEACLDQVQAWLAFFSGSSSLLCNTVRLGALRNSHQALRWGFDRGASFVVLAEEDAPVSADVVEFFVTLRDRYQADLDVLGVCAFSRLLSEDATAYGVQDFSPLVWGTWADRWYDVLNPRWFDAARGPAPGVEEGWDWGVRRVVEETSQYFLAPLQSRSQHIGEYGVHMRPAEFATSQAPSFVMDHPPTDYVEVVGRAV